jgi:flagellar biosynthesis protein
MMNKLESAAAASPPITTTITPAITPAISPAIAPLTTRAVALSYSPEDGAPKVVAKGKGLIAEAIIARANEHGIFIHQSKELVNLLMKVDLDDNIPPALYTVVAELLAWLYHIETESKIK